MTKERTAPQSPEDMAKAAYDIGAVQQQAELTQIAQKTYDCLETVR